MDLSGKVAIVTGASGGIGRAYALALAAAGADVVAAARTLHGQAEGTLGEVVAYARDLPGRVVAQQCDVTDVSDVRRLVDVALEQLGRLDVVVNNAGIYPHHPSLEVTEDQWSATLKVNVLAPYAVVRAAVPYMIGKNSGSIVNITSLAASHTAAAYPNHGHLLTYAVSKAALDRMTTYLALDLAPHGIAINALSPGAVLTRTFRSVDPEVANMALVSGWGKEPTPEVMGPPVVWLAAQTADSLTGNILHHDEFGRSWG
jgi:NAD(P)-dependent dehydrogenase (short-subunit alcohol dehydrogenase family)